jgi:hypothetical protein
MVIIQIKKAFNWTPFLFEFFSRKITVNAIQQPAIRSCSEILVSDVSGCRLQNKPKTGAVNGNVGLAVAVRKGNDGKRYPLAFQIIRRQSRINLPFIA